MITKATIFAIGLASLVLLATVPRNLDEVELLLTEIADSSSYYVYRYTASNPASSSWGVQRLVLGVAASYGTPATLPATGDFLDVTTWSGATSSLSAFAEVGPIAPNGWESILTRSAQLIWNAPSEGPVAVDSIPRDSELAGFGIRSSYLPGLSSISAEPTWQACCSVHDSVTLENPERSDFATSSEAVAPRYMPSEVDIDLLQSQVAAVCSDPLWVNDTLLCTALADSLQAGEDRLAINNYRGAIAVLDSLSGVVQAEQGQIHDNAYWMLLLNLEQASENLQAVQAEHGNALVWSPSSDEAIGHFSVGANEVRRTRDGAPRARR